MNENTAEIGIGGGDGPSAPSEISQLNCPIPSIDNATNFECAVKK
jgi:hypothetical protein